VRLALSRHLTAYVLRLRDTQAAAALWVAMTLHRTGDGWEHSVRCGAVVSINEERMESGRSPEKRQAAPEGTA
jgi:hypothetical protein